jgi:hypothetical protein
MSGRTGAIIGLGFALFWLWLGALALPAPWPVAVGIVGSAAVLAILIRQLGSSANGRARFARGRYLAAVALEFAALATLATFLARWGREDVLWPAAGIIIGLHFVGLWWASGQRRFLNLAAAMTAVNAVALLVPAPAMLATSGLGSYLALAATVATT